MSPSVYPGVLGDFDAANQVRRVPAGDYAIMVGRSATDEVLKGSTELDNETFSREQD